jgi:NAD(P)-dependent dehydrogenase (short-subunit alcohol dehydrogenase family)
VLAALTKGGLAVATRSLAVGCASRGILVNVVASGVIQTTVHPANGGSVAVSLARPAGQGSDVVDGVLLLEWSS